MLNYIWLGLTGRFSDKQMKNSQYHRRAMPCFLVLLSFGLAILGALEFPANAAPQSIRLSEGIARMMSIRSSLPAPCARTACASLPAPGAKPAADRPEAGSRDACRAER